jgi:hypothetical protein
MSIRRVNVAVELWDPVTFLPVFEGLKVSLAGREDPPIVNRSGRFVWIGREDEWPSALSVETGPQPYQGFANKDLLPLRPGGWPAVKPDERLIRIALAPRSTYSFPDGINVVRGTLLDAATPVAGAQVWMEWWDLALADWVAADFTQRVLTDQRGQFAAFTRIPLGTNIEPDVAGGALKARLAVTRAGETRSTPEDFPFLEDPALAGRIPDNAMLASWLTLDWAALV